MPGANLPLMAYGIKTVQLDGITNAATVTLVEGIPVIKVGEKH